MPVAGLDRETALADGPAAAVVVPEVFAVKRQYLQQDVAPAAPAAALQQQLQSSAHVPDNSLYTHGEGHG